MEYDFTKLDGIELAKGAHDNPEQGMCLLEAAAYVAGEAHSDRPGCVCPVVGTFGRPANDRMEHEDRQRLKALLPLMLGTAGSVALQVRRALRLADWATREIAPLALDKANLPAEAAKLRALSPIVDRATALLARDAAAAHNAASAAYYAAAAAAAYYAASAASAAYYAAYAAAYVAAAHNAASAAYYAAAAANATADQIIAILREICAMKEETT